MNCSGLVGPLHEFVELDALVENSKGAHCAPCFACIVTQGDRLNEGERCIGR
jgi:hypothetical protein